MSFRWPVFLLVLCFLASALPAAEPWLDIPFVPQTGAGCGAAAVAMVVQYWAARYPALGSVQSDSEHINAFLPAVSRSGIKGRALQHFLEQHSFRAFIFDGEMADLEHHFEKGRPVVACIAPGGKHAPLHYVVIAGVDGKEVWMNDPARGKLFHENRAKFLQEWNQTGNWALLAVPRQAQ